MHQVGALQDNGIYTTSTAVGREWKGNRSGDGGDVAFDGNIAGQVYGSRGFGYVRPKHVYFAQLTMV